MAEAILKTVKQQSAQVPVIASRADATAIARRLKQGIAARATEADRQRKVPNETIDELLTSGLFGVVTPKMFGGSELGFTALFDVAVELATACPSTGWVYGVVAGHSWLVNLFPLESQREVMSDPTSLTATLFRLGGTVTRVPGGFRLVGGEGRFASGIDHASWLVAGSAVRDADGKSEPYFFIIPTSQVEIIDDWHTVGMRATGSKSLKIAEAFIPSHRAARLSDMLAGTSPGADIHRGPLYRLPFSYVAPFSIVGSPIGAAVGGIETYRQMLESRLASSSDIELADAGDLLSRLAASAARVDAASALVRASAETLDALREAEDLRPADRARIPRNWAFAVQAAREAINQLYEVAGGSQIYDSSQLQRFWRDTNSGAQHFAFTWGNAMRNAGRAMIGKPPLDFQLKRS